MPMANVPFAPSPASPAAKKMVWLLAVVAGVTVANVYYNQPLLNLMAKGFHTRPANLGLVPMMTQAGYAVGLFIFVPLADTAERRRLITRLLVACAVLLLLAAVARSVVWLAGASFLIGIFSTVPQIAVPLAADLAHDRERGRVVGVVMSGLLMGILLARTVSGIIADLWGWRTVYVLAAVAMGALALTVRLKLSPLAPSSPRLPYRALLRSLMELWLHEPEIRLASWTGAAFFGAFSAFWTTLTFRLSIAPYDYSATIIGLFGLAGAAGALIAPVAGRLADRRDPRLTVSLALALGALAYLIAGLASSWLLVIIAAVIGLDVATNGAQISNQSRIYRVRPGARARSNTIYMVWYFTGGALGSGLGAIAWHLAGWRAVIAVTLLFLALGTAVHIRSMLSRRLK